MPIDKVGLSHTIQVQPIPLYRLSEPGPVELLLSMANLTGQVTTPRSPYEDGAACGNQARVVRRANGLQQIQIAVQSF